MIAIQFSDKTVWVKTVHDVVWELCSYYGIPFSRFMVLYEKIEDSYNQCNIRGKVFMQNEDLALYLWKM